MWIFPLVGYLGVILGFAFLVLAIASGLYYLSELVEEHTVIAKKLLYRLIYSVIAIQILLFVVDRFPFWITSLSIISHAIYAQNLRRFPIVKLSDPIFIVSCVLVLVNHYTWFRHFSTSPQHISSNKYPYRRIPDSRYPYGEPASFTEVASFFGLCVWLVPFSLFVSLSASENVLPSMGSEYATGEGSSFTRPGVEPGKSRDRAGMAKALVDGLRQWIGENGEVMGFWRGERTRPHL